VDLFLDGGEAEWGAGLTGKLAARLTYLRDSRRLIEDRSLLA